MTLRHQSLARQFQLNKSANLLNQEALDNLLIDSGFKEALLKAKRALIEPIELEDLIAAAVRECVFHVLSLNQFLVVSDTAKNKLADIYRNTWHLLKLSNDIDYILRRWHFPAVQQWISSLYPKSLLIGLRDQEKIRAVTCAEYSAVLQLRMLGLEWMNVYGPVLDIGCGYSASLVHYLQAHDIQAYGFDRLVESETDSIKASDWFGFDYPQKPWRTVISHMAFSNHYRYAINHCVELKAEMDKVLRQILSAMAPGGCLILAPAILELEQALPSGLFDCEYIAVCSGLSVMKIWKH